MERERAQETGGIKKREGKRRQRRPSKGESRERITGHIRKKCNYITEILKNRLYNCS